MVSRRSLICTTMGHIDHGKTLLLDKIRGSAVQRAEAGGITQAIGASIIPAETINKICASCQKILKIEINIPGLLFIDTPGHEAFTSLRKRGGNLADIAIVVISIQEGMMPQTEEAIQILRNSKTPFVIAANKIDLIEGWKCSSEPLVKSFESQEAHVMRAFDTKIYELVGQLFDKFGMTADRFDRISDYTKQVAIIPTSAMTGEGIPELLLILAGLAQKFLEESLVCDIDAPAKGTILELREEKGLGLTADVILYDGTLKANDTIVVGTLDAPLVTKVKAILEPSPLSDMRDKKSKFHPVKQVWAATGVKVSAPDLDKTVAGMPLQVASKETQEQIIHDIKQQVEEVLIQTDEVGVVAKADSLGSLEALIVLLKSKHIPIKKALIGPITRKDVIDAEANTEKDPLHAAVLGFNVSAEHEMQSSAKVITHNVIYQLIDDFEAWQLQEKNRITQSQLGTLKRPAKVEVLKGYVFRQSNPAVFGVAVLGGTLYSQTPLMNSEGKSLGLVRAMQAEQENVDKAQAGKQMAISMDAVTFGRQVNEGDILFVDLPEDDFKKLKEFKEYLSKDEIELLREIAQVKRKSNVVWGV